MMYILAVVCLLACLTECLPSALTGYTQKASTYTSDSKNFSAEMFASSEIYLYAWPLIMSYLTRRQMFYLPDNLMLPLPVFPNPNLTAIVKPNVDTLYDAGWINHEKAEELTLTIPDTNHGLYYLFPLMDAWTNIVASPGWRTTGKNAQSILIKGPFSNTTDDPELYDLIIRSPTSMAYILGRTNVPNPDHLRPTQKQMFSYRLIPNDWTPPATPEVVPSLPEVTSHSNPVEDIFTMEAREYYTLFAKLMITNPPILPQDTEIVSRMSSLFGLIPGQEWDYNSLSAQQRIELSWGMGKGIQLLNEYPTEKKNGWTIPDMRTGNFSDNYYLRAYIAYALYAANVPQDAVYFCSDMFKGAGNIYSFEFFPPQTNAFWSVTLYSDQGYLVANENKKYSVSSQQQDLKVNSDGSIKVTVSILDPMDGNNWLPAPQAGEDFQMTFRVYWPGENVLNNDWTPPLVTQMNV